VSTFGDQTVTFVAVTNGALDRLGIPAQVRTEIAVPGCRFRPLSAEETVGLTDLATEVWKCTAPPVAAVLAAMAIDEVKHNGITYQIVGGVKPYNDYFSNTVHKVTVLCQKQIG
jgi:hypothetical protein